MTDPGLTPKRATTAGRAVPLKLKNMQASALNDKLDQYDINRINMMFKYPADYQMANLHLEANKFGYNRKKKAEGEEKRIIPLCPCCESPINVQELGLCQSTSPQIRTTEEFQTDQKDKKGKKLKFYLNAGSSIFFSFLTMLVIFLFIECLVSNTYTLFNSFMVCSGECSASFLEKASIFNTKEEGEQYRYFIMIGDILYLTFVVMSIIFFFIYKRHLFKLYNEATRRYHTQDDYTVFMENLPVFINKKCKDKTYGEYLKQQLEQKISEWIHTIKSSPAQLDQLDLEMKQLCQQVNFCKLNQIRSISLCQNLSEMQMVADLRERMMQDFIFYNKSLAQQACCSCFSDQVTEEQRKRWLQEAEDSKQRIFIMNQHYYSLGQKFISDKSVIFHSSHFLGKAFVSFEFQLYRDYFVRECRKGNKLNLQGNYVEITKAVEPSDVRWYNLEFDQAKRQNAIIFSYAIMSTVLFTTFFLLVGIQFLKEKLTSALKQQYSIEEQFGLVYRIVNLILTSIMSILTVLVNYFLTQIIRYLTEAERHKTNTEHLSSLILKNVISQFINTALIYYVVFALRSDIDPTDQNGIVAQVMNLTITSCLVALLMNAFQPCQLWRKWRIRNYVDSINNKSQPINMFQIQLNRMFELPEFDFANRYSEYIVLCLTANFYAYITPLVTPIVAVTLFLQYWIDKCNLFRRFSCPVNYTYDLTQLTLKLVQSSILIFALGILLFISKVRQDGFSFLNLITVGIAGVYFMIVVLMPRCWEEFLYEFVQYKSKPFSYCLEKSYFTKCYWRCNPATCFTKEQNINNNRQTIDYGAHTDYLREPKQWDQFIRRYQRTDVTGQQ